MPQGLPKFEDTTEVKDALPAFDDTKELKPSIAPETSALAGTAQGLSFDFGDEIAGLGSATKDLVTGKGFEYKKKRDEWRKWFDEAQKTNPKSYLAGEAGGTVASAFIPGLGVVGNAGKLTKLGKIGKLAVGGAVAGGVSGLGASDSNDIVQQVKDAEAGAAFGGALGSSGGLLAKGIKAIPKTSMKAVFGIGEPALNRYMERSDKVNAARNLDVLAENVVENIGTLKNKVIEGSKAAVELIPDGQRVSANDIRAAITSQINPKPFTKEAIASNSEIKGLLERFNTIAKKGDGPNGAVELKELKGLIKQLDKTTVYKDAAGAFDEPANQALKGIRSNIDQILKGRAPEYEEAMLKVKMDTDNLKAATMFKNESIAASKLKQIAQRPKEKLTEAEALKGLDESLGTKISDENLDRIVKEGFDKQITNGSRNALTFGTIGSLGGALGSDNGYAGAGTGASLGVLAGFLNDKYGPRIAKKILDAYIARQSGIDSKLNKLGGLGEAWPRVSGSIGGKMGATDIP